MNRTLHTPEGVRDVYGKECAQKLELNQRLHQVLLNYGYEDIETPTFEYFEVFSQKVGTIPSKDLYKFFDREGNTLVLRPDFTPSVARAASTHSEGELCRKLCYTGKTFINHGDHRGMLKGVTQIGAESIGDATAEADGEILAMIVDLLLQAGLEEFQISVGQVDFFKSLLEEAGMTQEMEEELRSLISSKNFFGVEELLRQQNLSQELQQSFLKLPQLFGGAEVLDEARQITSNEKALAAIDRLEEIYQVLSCYGYEKYISFDLGMLSKYQYYTGIIFQAFTYGTGEPIAKGGRYNHLLEQFGTPAAAIGFAVTLELLLNAISRQNLPLPEERELLVMSYGPSDRKEVIENAQKLRKKGIRVLLKRREDV